MNAVREMVRNCMEFFLKWSNGCSEAKRALKRVAKYFLLKDKINEGSALSLLPHFGIKIASGSAGPAAAFLAWSSWLEGLLEVR